MNKLDVRLEDLRASRSVVLSSGLVASCDMCLNVDARRRQSVKKHHTLTRYLARVGKGKGVGFRPAREGGRSGSGKAGSEVGGAGNGKEADRWRESG